MGDGETVFLELEDHSLESGGAQRPVASVTALGALGTTPLLCARSVCFFQVLMDNQVHLAGSPLICHRLPHSIHSFLLLIQ